MIEHFIDFPVILKKRMHQTVFAYDKSETYKIASVDDLMKIISEETVDGTIYDFFKEIDNKEKTYKLDIPDAMNQFQRASDLLTYRFYNAKRNVALHFRSVKNIVLTQFKMNGEQAEIQLESPLNLALATNLILIDALGERYIMTEFMNVPITPVPLKDKKMYKIIVDRMYRFKTVNAKRRYSLFLQFSDGTMIKIKYSKSNDSKEVVEGEKGEALLSFNATKKEKLKIAIFGSCYSRRAFTSTDFYNPDYKNKYNIVLTQFQSSLCTFGENIPRTMDDPALNKELNINPQIWSKSERNKLFFKQLSEVQPDYLIIDLHGDIQRGYIEYPDGSRLTNAYFNYEYMKKYPEFTLYQAKENFADYFEEFKKNAKYFLSEVLEVVPENRIIVNRTNSANLYLNEKRELVPFPKKDTDVKTFNMIANVFSDYLLSLIPLANVIDSYDYGYHADIMAPGDHSINYFESNFYKHFMKDVDQAVILNEAQNIKKQKQTNFYNSSLIEKKDKYTIDSFEVIVPSGAAIDDDFPVARRAPRPFKERQKDYVKKFDYKTVYYDVFESNGKVFFSGPAFRNLESLFQMAEYTLFGSKRTDFPVVENGWKEQKVIFPLSYHESYNKPDRSFKIDAGRFHANGTIGKDILDNFKDLNCLVAINKDNNLSWIKDWATFYVKNHNVDCVIVYNNNSETYTNEELLMTLQSVNGLKKGYVVDWHYKFGPIGTRPGNHDSDYAQYVMLEHSRNRFFLKSAGVINCDIDELIVCDDKRTIFDHIKDSASGAVRFNGRWIENIRSNHDSIPKFSDFYYYDTERPATTYKYAFDPRRIPTNIQLWLHKFAPGFVPDEIEGIHHRHFKGISNDWRKNDRSNTVDFDESRHKVDKLWKEILESTFD